MQPKTFLLHVAILADEVGLMQVTLAVAYAVAAQGLAACTVRCSMLPAGAVSFMPCMVCRKPVLTR